MNLDIALRDTAAENAEVIPDALHTFFRDDKEVLGHLVIDSSINGLSAGGIRMVPSLPVADLCHLARAMTMKFSFLKWPFGGAKAAITTGREALSPEQRREILRCFAQRLEPFRRCYLPGQDVGTNADDLRLIRRIARVDRAHAAVDSAFHTALTVRICVEQIARCGAAALGGGPTDYTVAIEGLGKVGSSVARQLSDLGCRIVAVSTAKGAIHHPDGLDVARLLRARQVAGDDCIARYAGARMIDPAELLALPTDFLVPCALSWSIRRANADQVKAKIIVCGANNPVTEEARKALATKGVLYFPDFVSNSGGVLGSILETLCLDRARAAGILRRQFEPKVEQLLARSGREGRSWETVAADVAAANHREMKQRRPGCKGRLFSLVQGAFRRGLLPKTMVRTFGPQYVRRTMA